MTLQQALLSAARQLAEDPQLSDTARRDAESLMLHTTGISRAALLADPARLLTPEQLRSYEASIARRLRHEPLQYITGAQEFYGLPFRVTPAVLIPRPETEHLVEAVLERLPHDRSLAIADIGTGSGAIVCALATHLPQANLLALDLSPPALEIAQANAVALNVSERILFVLSDLLDALPRQQRQGAFDAIVSNPPYVPEEDAAELHPQVRDYEPASALFSGAGGLEIYKRLIPQAHEALKPEGLLALEIGHGQRDAVAGLLSGWRDVDFVHDLQSIPRVALARK
ncbi:peptide chain release factor N(5)-glutamine methyltransferase [Edaphobacter modestus]|uniref:Release factor glutamine methyltransferase n=1 Tax=Edaphobacter modestus TaxID=388466 RepID=A0A4Q7YX28_9BACT|nr:peptide chain release factor N(5)-glutamine methyltransferase [Edaphobacter modestus]RZU41629.1 release factor glutamine methyltransferase [Edaphobacter modestus]